MEITLESIISFIGLFIGGGAGAFFTWRWQKKKAKAEAETAEVETVKSMQEAYEKMFEQVNHYLDDATNKVDGLRQERDHYKQERDELRKKVDNLTKLYYEMKTEGERERSKLRIEITEVKTQLRQIDSMTCSVKDCPNRVPVITSEECAKKLHCIEPNNDGI